MFGEHITLKKITTECFPNHFFSIGKQIRKKLTFRCHCCFPVKTCFTDNLSVRWAGKKKKKRACLEGSSERPYAASGGMGAEPWGVPPGDLAIAACHNLLPTHRQFNQPLVGEHLPHHEASFLLSGGCRTARGWDVWSEVIHHRHHHLPGREYILDPAVQFPAARRRHKVLQDILRRGRHLNGDQRVPPQNKKSESDALAPFLFH